MFINKQLNGIVVSVFTENIFTYILSQSFQKRE